MSLGCRGIRSPRLAASASGLAADDLRDALVAHAHDLGDVRHRHVVPVGLADRAIPLFAQPLRLGLKLPFLARLGRSKPGFAGSGTGWSSGLSSSRSSMRRY